MIDVQKINGKDAIVITRGDCGVIAVNMGDYTMAADDTLELTVRNTPTPESDILLHVVSEAGSPKLILHSDETDIPAGRYSCDIQLNHNGCVYTGFPAVDGASGYKTSNLRNFIVCAEVTRHE